MEDNSDTENLPDSDLETLRQRRILQRKKLTEELFKDEEFKMVVFAENAVSPPPLVKISRKRKRTDATFRVSSNLFLPSERRRSDRIKNCEPIVVEMDDPEEFMYKAKRPRKSYNRSAYSNRGGRPPILKVEEVTDDIIRNVAQTVSIKKYSTIGTSCHQCRQKTLDQKTCCRNETCVGVRGQFCGVCLRNRYGEDAIEALKDPNWHCPVCRGICNCSFCMIKQGDAPTGIMIHIASNEGYKSVKHYLEAEKSGTDRRRYKQRNRSQEFEPEMGYKLLGFEMDQAVFYDGEKIVKVDN